MGGDLEVVREVFADDMFWYVGLKAESNAGEILLVEVRRRLSTKTQVAH